MISNYYGIWHNLWYKMSLNNKIISILCFFVIVITFLRKNSRFGITKNF